VSKRLPKMISSLRLREHWLKHMYTTRQKKNGFQPFVFLRTAWILTQC